MSYIAQSDCCCAIMDAFDMFFRQCPVCDQDCSFTYYEDVIEFFDYMYFKVNDLYWLNKFVKDQRQLNLFS